MKRILQMFIALSIPAISFGQLQNTNWCFGAQAKVNFNTTPPTSLNCPINSTANFGTGIASVSNDNGELLFYTNGNLVWGKNNILMPNGNHLFGGSIPVTGQQYTTIAPKPNSSNLYYIFTVSSGIPSSSLEGHDGIFYSVVDMNLNNGNENIITGLKNIPLKNHNGISIDHDNNSGLGLEVKNVKLTSTVNQSGDKIWATFLLRFDNGGIPQRYLYNYLISSFGINNMPDGVSPEPTASSVIPTINYPVVFNASQDQGGLIKISPNKSFLCDASTFVVNLYNFNNQTGFVTFNSNIYNDLTFEHVSGLGLEFSPNSQLVYFSTSPATIFQQGKSFDKIEPNYVKVYQNKIGNKNIELIGKYSIENEIEPNIVNPIPAQIPAGLQLAIDGKIYVCVGGFGGTRLGAIRKPNLISLACDFASFEIQLSTGSRHWGSLPQWVHSAAAGKWPKAYSGKVITSILKTDNGNLVVNYGTNYAYNVGGSMTPNLNHLGPLPLAPPPQSGGRQYTFQYTNSGFTNWTKTSQYTIFTLHNGDIQMNDPVNLNSTLFYKSDDGNLTAGPNSVPANERIIAETNNNGYLTIDPTFQLRLHSNSGNSTPIPLGINEYYLGFYKFNPSTNKLFVFLNFNGSYTLRIYSIGAANISLLTGKNLLPFGTNYGVTASVNNNDEIFVESNYQLFIVNYNVSANTATNTLVSIPGVSNIDIRSSSNNSPYTSNKHLFSIFDFLSSPISSDLYILDLTNFTTKKIHTTVCGSFLHLVDGNDIYLGVNSSLNPSFSIGNIQVNQLVSDKWQMNLFKFNLNTDFSRNQISGYNTLTSKLSKQNSFFEIMVSPNPAENIIRITIFEDSKLDKYHKYNLQITNTITNTLLSKTNYIPENLIDVSVLDKGIYLIEVISSKGEKASAKFIKL